MCSSKMYYTRAHFRAGAVAAAAAISNWEKKAAEPLRHDGNDSRKTSSVVKQTRLSGV